MFRYTVKSDCQGWESRDFATLDAASVWLHAMYSDGYHAYITNYSNA